MGRDGPEPFTARSKRVGRRMAEEWRDDRVPDLAAEVAFWAVLSLVPAFIATASVLGVLESVAGGEIATRVETEVIDFLESILTAEADGTLDAVSDLFVQRRPGLLTFSLLAALWALSRGFAALIRSLDVVYDLDDHRGWFQIRARALGLAVGSVVAGAVMLALLVVGPLFGEGADIAEELGFGGAFSFAWDVLRPPLAFLVLVVWAATIFHIAPDHHTPWRRDVPGAVLTAVLWVAFSGGLRVYLQVAQSGNAVFGALGGVLIVLLWFWLLSLAVLIGGELNEILLEDLDPPRDPSELVERVPEAAHELAGLDGAPAVEQEPHDGRGDDDAVGGDRRSGRRLG